MRTFRSIDEIRTATEDGSFDENHYLEAKTLLKSKSSTDKQELARDLAQFAFDGGTVVFGVREDKGDHDQRFRVEPIPLGTNVREQVEQIARERCQPPLYVQVREVRSEDDPDMGCLVVEVPPSTTVPHMVGGKYPYRGDASRGFLGDSEVRMWIARSEDVHEKVEREVRALVARDPYAGSDRAGHLFGVALPLTSRHDDLPAKRDLQPILYDAANAFQNTWRSRFGANDRRSRAMMRQTALSSAGQVHPRSGEYALRTMELSDLESGGDGNPKEEFLAEWAVDTTGAIRIYDAGLSVHRQDPRGRDVHAVWAEAPVELLGILVESARLSGERMGYHGQWGIGYAWTGLRGAATNVLDPFRSGPVVDRGEGSHQLAISALELADRPGDVVARLARPLLRMLDAEGYLYPLEN